MTNECSIGERGHLFKHTHRTRAIATQRIYRGTHIRLLYTERRFNHTFTCKQHTHDTRMHAKIPLSSFRVVKLLNVYH